MCYYKLRNLISANIDNFDNRSCLDKLETELYAMVY